MSSNLDPAKLKVVELRAELSKRGLDSKGNKPALVKRLKEALEEELKQELPDTSIADTSTEDLDTSQNQEQSVNDEPKVPVEDKNSNEETTALSQQTPVVDSETTDAVEQKEQSEETSEPQNTKESLVTERNESAETKVEESTENKESSIDAEVQKANGEKQDESKSEKSEAQTSADGTEPMVQAEVEQTEPVNTSESKGEKRKHSPSPDRSQRRRSKSPIKEDEPHIDQDKVQLSWYDSDLHLQVDKESFLSAKPYHEGAFGFAWAGVRATHGVNFGKVCFEVKITEELKWEDFSKYYDKQRREQSKSSSRQKSNDKNKMEADSNDKEDENKNDDHQEMNKDTKNDVEMNEVDESSLEQKKDEVKTEDVEVKETDQETSDKSATSTENQQQTEEKEQVLPLPTHLFRVGWSLIDSDLQLGEDKYSYGYESSGRFAVDKQFQNYGIKFGVGDVVTSFLNINEDSLSISYAVNGVPHSEAVSVPVSELPQNFALFPHVLSRNYAFELNLGSKEESWFALPEDYEDYKFLSKVEDKIAGPVRPEKRSDCEVILMCGLPASGKTHWVKEYLQANPEKKYTVLGNTHLLEKMTVSGNALKSKYQGSWNILLEKLQKCINKLVEIAALRRRNYIIDQPNVYPSAQRRKMRPFEGFKRRAVVVVVGDEEQAKRQSLQEAEGGKDVPDSIILDMKANMSLPQKGDWIDEVVYVGVNEEEAKALVQKYNNQARETIGIQRRFGHRDDRHRWQMRRNDFRGGNYRDRGYHNSRYDRGPPRQGNWHPHRPAGWSRDRRDNRGPPMGGSRDWRNRGNGRDRNNREVQGSNYNRNRNAPARGPGGNWPSGWGQSQASWGNQAWSGQSSWGQTGWGNQNNQNQWKYGGGSQGYGNYSNWNYYGQYPQNWGSQNQTHTTSTGTNQYGQYSQQDWAQYAQQYAQQGQNTPATTQPAPQK